MPIVNSKLTAPPEKQPNTVRIAAPGYSSVVNDTRYIPVGSLLTHLDGSSWSVWYYSQILTNDSALAGQNITRNPIYQQYRLIKNFELKVTTPLDTAQDETSKTMVITGVANVSASLIPNEGDMLIADIGDGREGIFRVTVSQRKSVFKDTVHVIEYQMIDYATDERKADLNLKVVETLQFSRDFLLHGQSPYIQEDDFVVITKLQQRYTEIATRYFKTYTSSEYRTLLIPGQPYPTYDPLLTKAITSFFTTYDTPELRYIRKLNCDDDNSLKSVSIWDVLIAKDLSLLPYCMRQTGLVSAREFTSNPSMEGVYYSGIEYVVYPLDSELSIDDALTGIFKVIEPDVLVDTPSKFPAIITTYGVTNTLLVNSIQHNGYYLFSQAFYENTPIGQSCLELCVRDYLSNRPLDNQLLLKLCDAYPSWSTLARFYYVPVLLLLIKASVRIF